MSPKFSRFLHLERSRGERSKAEEPSRLQSGQRFEALAEKGEAPQSAAVPETHLERFRGEAPLALADAPREEERFPRCARCESENGRFVRECTVCGADLTTPQQREYNERLWQTRQAQEREYTQALEKSRQQAEARRQEELADRARLTEQLRSDPWGDRQNKGLLRGHSLGMFLLSIIPSKAVRWGIGVGLILLPFLIARFGPPRVKLMAGPVALLLVLLFLPPSRRKRWWHGW
ncbi:MAG TPA: hypothetical protein VNA24_26805 [Hyalangium sp.]|nr:hypothetical protein [Hyalangium sp.]